MVNKGTLDEYSAGARYIADALLVFSFPVMALEAWFILNGHISASILFTSMCRVHTSQHQLQITMKVFCTVNESVKPGINLKQEYNRFYQAYTSHHACEVKSMSHRVPFFPLHNFNADIILQEQCKDSCIYSPTLILFTYRVNLSLCLLYVS